MEGFSRVLWGLASYWAGGGKDESLLSVYQKGLAAGTDPEAPSYWGDLHNKDQRMVEMAAISYGILLIPEKLWEPLSEVSKDHLADWLYQINLYSQADNNWHYFKVIANLALKSVGKKWNQDEVKKAMDSYESFYLGNGWYSDGKRPQKDYWMKQPIFDNGGILTVGYTYPNLFMSETYNAPGSPYWALKAFVFLALPDDHPFWQADEAPFPSLEPVHCIRECDMLICHRSHEAVALTAGQGIVIRPFSNMNLIFPNVRIPAVRLSIKPGVTELESRVTASFTQKDIVIGGGNCYVLRD